jgi:hypothetical protein
LATWLLDQFSPVLQNAPLAGDLMEAFKQGRSSSWYWRQVFGAILIALPSLLRKQWGCLAYAVGCSGLISAAWFFMSPTAGHGSALPQVFAIYAKGYAIQWPWSLVYQISFLTAFQFVIVAVALGAYLAFSRILNPQNLLRALMVVVVVLASGNVAMTFLSVLSVMRLGLLGWVLSSKPTIAALLLGMWNANLGCPSRPIST